MKKKTLFLFLLAGVFSQCTSVQKLLESGEIARADITQPFSFEYKDKLLFIDVRVNGQPRRFIIDSGAPTVVSRELKEELQLKSVKRAPVSDSQDNSSKLEFVMIDSLAFGGVVAANSTALVVDFSLFHCLDIDGLLGANVMSHFDWEIDYQQERIQLYHKDGPGQPEDAYTISVPFETKAQGTPELKLDIPGLLSASRVAFDLGSTGGASIKRPAGLKIRRDSLFTFSYGRTSKGIYGANTDTIHFFLVDSLFIGGTPFQRALVTTYNTSNKIGNAFWENYKLLISWSDSRLYLSPLPAEPPRLPEEWLRIGYEDGAVRILTVYEKMPSAHGQLAAGDTVIQINNDHTEGISVNGYCSLREQRPEKMRLKIRRQAGGEVVEIDFQPGQVRW